LSQFVIRNPEAPRSWAQARCIFGFAKRLGYAQEKCAKLSAKPKTKGQAHKMIQNLQKRETRLAETSTS